MHFKANLGSEHIQTFRFINYLKKSTNYTIKLSKVDESGVPTDFKSEVATLAAQASDSINGN